ncbi:MULTISPECIES: hypothetical protein [Kitasatospora]|uniref:hypothetical protein n=1 Tax=Kitasatospora TaxID=2063 RepID=UPI000C6FF192|nr:hypothetical protein [Kitasatospora sp. GP30]MDH6139463.1 hypothetical protein [Kitasatospora sp. GP30]
MPENELPRFLAALSPASLEKVRQQTPEKQAQLASAWETELIEDTDLDTLSELSPPAAEEEAAERVVRAYFKQ